MKTDKANSDYWKNKKSYTLLQASYLILNLPVPPYTYKKKPSGFPPLPSKIYEPITIDARVNEIFESLIYLIDQKKIPLSRSVRQAIQESSEPDLLQILINKWRQKSISILDLSELLRLDRVDLISFFSKNDNQPKPKFLFPENGEIPDAKDKRKQGMAKTIRNSMDRSLQASVLVGEWINENKFKPVEITKSKVQDYLFDIGYGETKILKDVWKNIPDKNSGGRPPKE